MITLLIFYFLFLSFFEQFLGQFIWFPPENSFSPAFYKALNKWCTRIIHMVTNKSKEASETGDSPFQSLTSSRYFALPSISVDLMLPILAFIPINGVYNWFLMQYILSLKMWKYFIWNALKAATCIKQVVHAIAYDGNARTTRIKFNQGTKIIRDLHIFWPHLMNFGTRKEYF